MNNSPSYSVLTIVLLLAGAMIIGALGPDRTRPAPRQDIAATILAPR